MIFAHLSETKQELLETHLSETAAYTGSAFVRYCALLHDGGKISGRFQKYLHDAVRGSDAEKKKAAALKGKIPHAAHGARLVLARGEETGLFETAAALVISSHHAGLPDCVNTLGESGLAKRLGAVDEAELHEIKQSKLFLIPDALKKEAEAELNAAVISIKQEAKKPKTSYYLLGLWIKMKAAQLMDADRACTAHFYGVPLPQRYDMAELAERFEKKYEEMIEAAPKTEINAIRSSIAEECKKRSEQESGIFRLTVPTGGGKTLSALRFGLWHAAKRNKSRIFFISPFITITEQNADVARRFLGDDAVLEHHSNFILETDDTEELSKRRLLEQNWNAPIVFTTMARFLETLFSAKTSDTRRLAALEDAVLIFDEIQCIPVRCIFMFNGALRFLTRLCGCTAVLCTATQPLLERQSQKNEDCALPLDEACEIAPDVSELFQKLERVRIESVSEPVSDDDIAALAQRHPNALVITNSKAQARGLFELLTARFQKENVFYLSTDLCPEHRLSVLKAVQERLSRKQPVYLVSTSLIEAGVDISFACVVRYGAGLGSVAQAAGRCNRNGENAKKGTVYLVSHKEERFLGLKEVQLGAEILRDMQREGMQKLLEPAAMQRYFRDYYAKSEAEMSYAAKDGVRNVQLYDLLSDNAESAKAYAQTASAKKRCGAFSQAFETAGRLFRVFEDDTVGVLVPYGEGSTLISQIITADFATRARLLKKAQRYCVNVYRGYKLNEMMAKGFLYETEGGLLCAAEEYYDKQLGLGQNEEEEPTIF